MLFITYSDSHINIYYSSYDATDGWQGERWVDSMAMESKIPLVVLTTHCHGVDSLLSVPHKRQKMGYICRWSSQNFQAHCQGKTAFWFTHSLLDLKANAILDLYYLLPIRTQDSFVIGHNLLEPFSFLLKWFFELINTISQVAFCHWWKAGMATVVGLQGNRAYCMVSAGRSTAHPETDLGWYILEL